MKVRNQPTTLLVGEPQQTKPLAFPGPHPPSSKLCASSSTASNSTSTMNETVHWHAFRQHTLTGSASWRILSAVCNPPQQSSHCMSHLQEWKPPVHQHLPMIPCGYIAKHIQAVTQRLPLLRFHCLCNCPWCQWHSCSQGEQSNEVNTVHGRPDIVAVLYIRWVSIAPHD